MLTPELTSRTLSTLSRLDWCIRMSSLCLRPPHGPEACLVSGGQDRRQATGTARLEDPSSEPHRVPQADVTRAMQQAFAVDLAGIETGEQNTAVGFDASNLNVGMRVAPTGQRRPEVAGGDRTVVPEYQAAGAALASRPHHCHQLIGRSDHGLRASYECAASQCKGDIRARSLKDRHPDRTFQLQDVAAEGRLFDVKRPSGAIEAAMVCCYGVAKPANVKGHRATEVRLNSERILRFHMLYARSSRIRLSISLRPFMAAASACAEISDDKDVSLSTSR